MVDRHIEFSLTRKTVEDIIAAHLYAIGTANDNEEIVFEGLSVNPTDVPIKIKLSKEVACEDTAKLPT